MDQRPIRTIRLKSGEVFQIPRAQVIRNNVKEYKATNPATRMVKNAVLSLYLGGGVQGVQG